MTPALRACLLLSLAGATHLKGTEAPLPARPASGAHATEADDYAASVLEWRQRRVERLRAAEGWLTVVGRSWLKPGPNTIGSSAGCDIRLPGGPALLLTVTLGGDTEPLDAQFPDRSPAMVDGKPAVARMQLRHDGDENPSTISCGSLTLTLLRRGDRTALRIRDAESEARRLFTALDYFPIDPSWRITARWVPFDTPRSILVENVIGQTVEESAPGKAVFERDGKTWELIPTQDSPGGTLFFVLRDLTSGNETYGASRFLVADAPRHGTVILDFNKAYNPPCAFTGHATCPLPIAENKLKLAIRAGEKTYTGPVAE